MGLALCVLLIALAAAMPGAAKTGYQASPATRAGLVSGVTFTQTYSTAATTVPADTSHAITDSSGGTASTTAIAAQAATVAAADTDTSAAQKAAVDAQLVIIRNNVATLAAELALTKADALATKKVANKLIDVLQTVGICL